MQTEIYRPSRYVQSSAEKSSVSNCSRFECGRVDRKRWLKMILKHLANGCFRRSYMYGSRKQKKKECRRVSSYFVRQCLSFISVVNSRDISVLGSFFPQHSCSFFGFHAEKNSSIFEMMPLRRYILLYKYRFDFSSEISDWCVFISVFFLLDPTCLQILCFSIEKQRMSTNIPKI